MIYFEIFEGMKAYKDKNGKTRLFRPDKNHERLTKSAQRLALPVQILRWSFLTFQTMDYNGFLSTLKSLIKVDEEWIPSKKGFSLYIRYNFLRSMNSNIL